MNPAETAVESAGEPARSRPVLRGDVSDRDRHYGVFYGVAPLPGDADSSGDAGAGDAVPRVVVVGNCQAESLRIVLESSGDIQSFRVPPIHEWETRDMPFVEFAMQWANVLVTQPVRNDYRGLPCGTEQLSSLMRTDGSPTHVLRYPVLRFSALNPRWAIVRSPLDSSLSPPVVPYHDLHLIAQLAGLQQVNEPDYQGIVEANVQLMAAREGAHGTVGMSTYLRELPEWHTLNHPNNATLAELGTRVMQASANANPRGRISTARSAPPSFERCWATCAARWIRARWKLWASPHQTAASGLFTAKSYPPRKSKPLTAASTASTRSSSTLPSSGMQICSTCSVFPAQLRQERRIHDPPHSSHCGP